jgi:nicotinamide-nucleotide amidase
MISEIISVGTELCAGVTLDTNSAWLAQGLAGVGFETRRHITVGDIREDIAEAILAASKRADVVLVTGGLGPTEDDLTREGLADAMGVALVRDTAALSRLKGFFAERHLKWVEANERQAFHPVGTALLENDWGTAPGIRAPLNRARVYCLPGVPREMRLMFEERVVPDIQAHGGWPVARRLYVRALHCFGAGEAKIGDAVADLMQPGRPLTVGITASEGIITLRFFAWSASEAEADAVISRDIAEVRSRIGRLIFGEGEATLASTVGELLVGLSSTVATAESCTGGLVARMITDVPGSSRYFLRGLIPYANEAKVDLLNIEPELLARHGAVSEAVAVAMANQCRIRAGSSYAVSITGIAGPGGGTEEKPVGLVYIAVAGPRCQAARKLLYGSHLSREDIRIRSSLAALNLLRLTLLDDLPGL